MTQAAVARADDLPAQRESNSTFAARVGCNHTTASRLRSGQRMPSPRMLVKICDAYGLPYDDALAKQAAGPEVFSAWLREHVFPQDDTPEDA